MPAVAYAMTDLHPTADGRRAAGAVSVPSHRGGCGQSHEVGPLGNGRFGIECDACAPALTGGTYGWSNAPGGVPLTPDEVQARELAKRDAEAGQAMILQSMTDAFVRNMANMQMAVTPPASLAEQVTAMSAAEKAELLALLGGTADEPAKADTPAKAAKTGPRRTAD